MTVNIEAKHIVIGLPIKKDNTVNIVISVIAYILYKFWSLCLKGTYVKDTKILKMFIKSELCYRAKVYEHLNVWKTANIFNRMSTEF